MGEKKLANTDAAPVNSSQAIRQLRSGIESRQLARTRVAVPQRRSRVVFVMPRCRHDHVRGVHKQAYSLSRAGYEVVLVVKDSAVSEYLGMQIVVAKAPFETVFRPLLNLPALFRQAQKLKGDVYVLRNPDTILLALALTLIGHKVVYDTHEDFSKRPLMHRALPKWARPTAAWLITNLERLLARMTRGVFVTQAQQPKILGGRTLLQPNAPLTSGPIIEAAHATNMSRKDNELSLIYVGEITRRRGILSMLNMIERMNRQGACCLHLVGWIRSEKLKQEVTQHRGWRYVNFHGSVSHAETLAHIMRSDIGLAILDPVADYPTTSVTKLFEYMQFGIPIIASNFPAWNVLTENGPPGLYVDPTSLDDIVAAGLQMAADPAIRERMGAAGKRFIETEFNWELISEPFLDLISGLSDAQQESKAQMQ